MNKIVNKFLLPGDKFILKLHLRIHLRLWTILKTSNKSISNVFLICKISIFRKCIKYTIHWDKTQMLKQFLRTKWMIQKMPFIFLSQAPTHHIFNFNLWVLYELKNKVCLSKNMCWIFHFQFRFISIEVYIFI